MWSSHAVRCILKWPKIQNACSKFDSEEVGAVAREFNRYNRRKIVVVDPSVASLPISGLFHTHDIDSFAQFLNGLPGVQTTVNSEKLLVSGRTVVRND
jgi:ferric-dicitrate binding protein FerR (iron transport regulator)